MTIAEAIALVDKFKPNQYDTATKIAWLSLLDGHVQREIIMTHEHDTAAETFAGYTPTTDQTTALLVPYPYDQDLYNYYLQSMIDRENGEAAKYNQSAALYNASWTAYQSYYNRTVAPLPAATQFVF